MKLRTLALATSAVFALALPSQADTGPAKVVGSISDLAAIGVNSQFTLHAEVLGIRYDWYSASLSAAYAPYNVACPGTAVAPGVTPGDPYIAAAGVATTSCWVRENPAFNIMGIVTLSSYGGNFAAADAAATAAGKGLGIDIGFNLTGNTVSNAPFIKCEGGLIATGSYSFSMKILNCPDTTQLFDLTGTGVITISGGSASGHITPIQFGAVADSTGIAVNGSGVPTTGGRYTDGTNSTNAFTRAVGSGPILTGVGTYSSQAIFIADAPPRKYYRANIDLSNIDNLVFEGQSQSARIVAADRSLPILNQAIPIADDINDVVVKNIMLFGGGTEGSDIYANSSGIYFSCASGPGTQVVYDHVKIDNVATGLYIGPNTQSCYSNRFLNVYTINTSVAGLKTDGGAYNYFENFNSARPVSGYSIYIGSGGTCASGNTFIHTVMSGKMYDCGGQNRYDTIISEWDQQTGKYATAGDVNLDPTTAVMTFSGPGPSISNAQVTGYPGANNPYTNANGLLVEANYAYRFGASAIGVNAEDLSILSASGYRPDKAVRLDSGSSGILVNLEGTSSITQNIAADTNNTAALPSWHFAGDMRQYYGAPVSLSYHGTTAYTNVTGNGGSATAHFDGKDWDIGSNFNGSTFTAPPRPTHIMFTVNTDWSPITSAMTSYDLSIVCSSAGTKYIQSGGNPWSMANASGEFQVVGSVSVNLSASETCYVRNRTYNGAGNTVGQSNSAAANTLSAVEVP